MNQFTVEARDQRSLRSSRGHGSVAQRAQASRAATDGDFLAALVAHEAQATERFVRTETPRLLSVARRLLRNEDDAREAVQEAFVSAFRSLGSFAGKSTLSTWLCSILINVALMKLRARRRHPEESIEPLLPRFLEDGHHASPPSDWPSPEGLLEQRELRDAVWAAIDRLPESYRSVLVLREIEQLDTLETARALGASPGAVKVRLHRAHQALRTLLDPHLRRVA